MTTRPDVNAQKNSCIIGYSRLGEKIGELISRSTGAYFCIGSGKESPQLHNPDYDFPDALIEIAGNIFFGIARQILTVQTI